jgi:hypothetical protein
MTGTGAVGASSVKDASKTALSKPLPSNSARKLKRVAPAWKASPPDCRRTIARLDALDDPIFDAATLHG